MNTIDRFDGAGRLRAPMVSATQQSFRIRRRKQRKCGVQRKRDMRAHGTPVFAIHPEGYDATAADAKPLRGHNGGDPHTPGPAGPKPTADSPKNS